MGLLRNPEPEGCGPLGEPDEEVAASHRKGVEQAPKGSQRQRQRADCRDDEQVGEWAEER